MKWSDNEVKFIQNNSYKYNLNDLSSILDKTKNSIRHKLNRMNLEYINKRRKVYINKNYFKCWSNDMTYILGFWFADGCIWSNKGHYNINFTSNDVSLLKKIRHRLNSNHKLFKRKSDNSYKLEIGCKEMYNDIKQLGGCERKSLVNKFPIIPKNYIRHFIRGYFDGDGSVTLRNNEPRINFVGTLNFLKGIELNLPYKGNLRRVNANTYELIYTAEYAREILKFMYNNCNLYLMRKYLKYIKSKYWVRSRRLRIDSNLYKLNGLPRSYNYENCYTK